MVPITRRDALRGATALLAVGAGCNDVEPGGSPPTTRAHRGPENVVVDPPHVTLRGGGEAPVVWVDETDGTSGDDDPRRRVHRFVADADTADRLRVADRVDAGPARSFLDATDFDAETVYVEEMGVGECYALDLCYVGWSATDVETDYGRRLRDVSVSCSADAHDTVATLVRIPDALDPDDVHGFGSGMSSGGCRLPPWIRDRAASVNESTDGSTPDSTRGDR